MKDTAACAQNEIGRLFQMQVVVQENDQMWKGWLYTVKPR